MKKRFGLSVWLTTTAPLAVIFVLTAHPARLYAEAGIPFSCTDREVEACAGKEGSDPCSWDAGAGTCHPSSCADPDGGAFVNGLRCEPNAVAPDGGSDAGSDANGDAAAAPDGSTGGSSPAEGCSAAGAALDGSPSSAVGSLLALGAMLRLRRRRDRASR